MIGQARELRQRINAVQEQMKDVEVTGESGGGMVTAVFDCSGRLRNLKIEPSALAEPPEILQDLIVAAVNEGLRKAAERMRGELESVAGGLNLPSGLLSALT